MKLSIPLLALMLLAMTSGCAREESATEGLHAIIDLYKAGNYEVLVKERYAELFKAKDDAQVEQLVAHFAKRFSNEAKLKQALEMLSEISKVAPEVTPVTKDTPFGATKSASFDFGEERPYVLWLLPSGKWAFTM